MKRRAESCRSVATCLIMLMLFAILCVPGCFAVDAAEASNTITQAESDLDSAYVAVAEAEGAGADVSALLSKLGGAGDFLSAAYAAFRTGNYSGADSLAMDCSSALEGVVRDSADLKAEAEAARGNGLVFNVVISLVGLVLLGVLGFWGWKLLKQRYFKQILDMKPQVEEAE
jgi:hypothetical protein